MWSLGVQEGLEYQVGVMDGPPNMRHDCSPIFTFGGLIYITDEVFEEKPQLALQIVGLFFAKIEKLRQLDGPNSSWHEVKDACILWRLCVRPELMEYLYERCMQQGVELDAGDPDVQARAQLYQILCETNYIEQDGTEEPLSTVEDKFPILSERRILAEVEPVDYFNSRERSQEEANLAMIRYYAGLHVAMRRDYRQFFVVHTEPFAPCVREWKREIQSIAEVISPEQCVAELSKDPYDVDNEQMFDFCERMWSQVEDEHMAGALVTEFTKFLDQEMRDSPMPSGVQSSLDIGEIRESQYSMDDGEIYPTP